MQRDGSGVGKRSKGVNQKGNLDIPWKFRKERIGLQGRREQCTRETIKDTVDGSQVLSPGGFGKKKTPSRNDNQDEGPGPEKMASIENNRRRKRNHRLVQGMKSSQKGNTGAGV